MISELQVFVENNEDLLGRLLEDEETAIWKREEISVKIRQQSAVIKGSEIPCLSLPTAPHMTLAWQYFCGQFPDRHISYETLYGEEVVERNKEILRSILVKAAGPNQFQYDLTCAIDALCDH